MTLATLAGGCFWGIEAAYMALPGVIATRVGYTGGTTIDPTYQDVCQGDTGHVEAVQITYDPQKISYRRILTTFFSIHDPTSTNRQGDDTGPQYQSVIFYHDMEQHKEAWNCIQKLNESNRYQNPVVTEVREADVFYEAEEYHQQFYLKIQERYKQTPWG